MTKYTFISDDHEGKQIMLSLDTKEGTWGDPMNLFFDFLKANGFVFDINSYMGIMDGEGNFRCPEDFLKDYR
jgi:hypothetical protein